MSESEPARELAAKLAAITAAAPGLRAAGVTKVAIASDSFELLELPPAPPADGEAEIDPYTLEGYLGSRGKPAAGRQAGGAP